MSNKTTNYNLVKPSDGEYYDISVPNGNMDLIDTELKKGQDHRENSNNPHGVTAIQVGAPAKTLADLTYYVDVTIGNDSNNGLTALTSFKTFAHLADIIPQVVNHIVTVYVAAGTYPDDLLIQGRSGCGQIKIIGGNSYTYSQNYKVNSILINRNSCEVLISGIKPTTVTADAITISESKYCRVESCLSDAVVSNFKAFYIFASTAKIYGCSVSNRTDCVVASMSLVDLENNTGTNNINNAVAYYATIISEAGAQFAGANRCYSGAQITVGDKSSAGESNNLLINGDMRIQKHVSALPYQYVIDRWRSDWNSSQGTITCHGVDDGHTHYIESVVSSVTGSQMFHNVVQTIENNEDGLCPYAEHTVTFSAEVNGNSDAMCLMMSYINSSGTSVVLGTTNVPLMGGRISVTGTLPTGAKTLVVGLGCNRYLTAADVGTWHNMWNAKLEYGSIATPFVPKNLNEEIAACQRFYFDPYSALVPSNGWLYGTTLAGWGFIVRIPLPVNMRRKPTVITPSYGYTRACNDQNAYVWQDISMQDINLYPGELILIYLTESWMLINQSHLVDRLPCFDAEYYV